MALSIVENGKKLENVIDFSKFINEIKKHWWKVALLVVIVTGSCYPFIQKIESQYVSTATVLIKAQADNTLPIDQIDGYDSTRGPYYETQYSLMQSRVIIERTVKNLKLDQNPKFNGENAEREAGATSPTESPSPALKRDSTQFEYEGSVEPKDSSLDLTPRLTKQQRKQRINNAINSVRKNLTISGVRLTQLVYISYESASAEEAAKIANSVAHAYIEYTIEQKSNKIITAEEWSSQRLKELKQTMLDQKDEIEQLLRKEQLLTFRGVDGFETETLGIVTNKLADAKDRRLTAKANLDVISQTLGNPLQDVITFPEISSHAQIQDLRIALISANKELYELSKRFGPKHNKILSAKDKIQAIQDQTQMVLRELRKGLLKTYQAALKKEKQYDTELNGQKNAFKEIAAKRDKYNTLKTELDKTEDLYKQIYQRSQEQSILAKYREADSVLYDPAVAPEKPSKPNKSLFLIMVFMGALIMSVVVLIVKAALHNKVDCMSHLQSRLGLKPLGEFGYVALVEDSLHKSAALALCEDKLIELVHGIRTNILLDETAHASPSAAKKWRTMALVSAAHGEGRSLLSYLLATSFSQDSKTLLVDLDCRNANSLTKDFGLQSSLGLADAVNKSASISDVITEIQSNLSFLPLGQLQGSALLMLSSDHLVEIFSQLALQYDRILIDLPEVGQYKDPQLLSRIVDGAIWVVNAGALPSREMLKAIRLLESSQMVFCGGVINRVTRENMQSEEGKQLINDAHNRLFNKAPKL
ncbi:MAG: polysaccharide biosynthesis tyrosine autokinase [Psychromonas sp.]